MVPSLSIAAMVFTLLICFGVPIIGVLWLRRSGKPVARAFFAGMLAFAASRTRIPLLLFVVPGLPEPARGFITALPSLSFSAGLFEQTGRLLVMLWLLKRYHRLSDGLAFGLGHGGLEAMAITGLTYVNNLVIAVMMNTGSWAGIAKTIPADAASTIEKALTTTSPALFASAGLERIGAIALHTMLSLVILTGIVRSRKALAWIIALLAHGCGNLAMISAVEAGWAPLAIEIVFVLLVAALLAWTIRTVRPALPAWPAPLQPTARGFSKV